MKTFLGTTPASGACCRRNRPAPGRPGWPEFLRGCLAYRQSLDEQAPHAPRSKEPYPRS